MALHLNFALNLDSIADRMIDEVSRVWNSPFNPPKIIFSDYKLEQWFCLRWMEKKGVLANLNKSSMDSFLFEILGGNDKTKKLSSELLRNTIVAYLQNIAAEGKENLSQKFSPYVANYLFVKDKSDSFRWDESRAFDLANKMAALFLEYETSRPSGFWNENSGNVENQGQGILDCWKEGHLQSFFKDRNGVEVENEDWERKLYSAIFHKSAENGKSLLTAAFEKVNPDSRYLTLPFMFEACKENGTPKFHFDSSEPVFILGLSGMGQFYRVVLREFAKTHEVYAYIQNPCMQFWEDLRSQSYWEHLKNDGDENLKEDENDLLRAWGRAGRDSIKLWCLANDYNFDFPKEEMEKIQWNEEVPGKTLLSEIQRMVANRNNAFSPNFSIQDSDDSISITSAPTKVREVEAIHSRICKLLLNGASMRDILVVSPNLPDYYSAILQVFDQKEKGDEDGVHLPFSIVDSAEKESLVGNALEKLFSIKRNGALSRPDFFSLMRNPVVQSAWKIEPEEVAKWESWVSEMNVYRDCPDNEDKKGGWLWGVRRLLLSRLSDSPVGDCLPYSDMESGNDKLLTHFADAVESLENWIQMKPISLENSRDFSEWKNFLCEWLLMQIPPKGLDGEGLVFQNVLESIDGLAYQFAAGASEISWNMVYMTLRESTQNSSYSFGSLLINGITFMKFAPNRTIPVKHLFFMGANAKDFPGASKEDSLDLRKSVKSWPGDDTSIDKNRYAFLCQLMSTSASFHISYQGWYLPKDEELYPSSVVNDLKNLVEKASGGKIPLNVQEIKIDENRSWKELFTARERRNKMALKCFSADEKNLKIEAWKAKHFSEKSRQKKENLPIRVSASSIRKFLEDPFEFQANRSLNVEEIEKDPEKISLEPIELTPLEEAMLLRRMVAEKLGIEQDESEMNQNFLLQKGAIPRGDFGEEIWKSLDEKATSFAEKIRETLPKGQFASQKLEVSLSHEKASWTLMGNISILQKLENEVNLVEVKRSIIEKKDLEKNSLPSYVNALGLLAAGEAQTVQLFLFGGKNEVEEAKRDKKPYRICLQLKKEDAQNRLNQIYGLMYDENFRKAVPITVVADEKKELDSFEKLFPELNSALKYFTAKDLLDIQNPEVCGYAAEGDFGEEWKVAREKMRELMPELFSNGDCSCQK